MKTHAELNVGREEVNALVGEERALHERGHNDTLLAMEGAEEVTGEPRTGVRHGEGRRARTVLGLDDLVTTELDAVNEGLVGLTGDRARVLGLGDEGNDGRARVATDDSHGNVLGVSLGEAGKEALSANDVEGGDTEDVGGVVHAGLLEDGRDDGDGRVDGVGDDKDVRLGRNARDGSGKVADDRRVRVEEVITGHLRRGVSTERGGRKSGPEFDLHQAGQGRERSVRGEWYEMRGRAYLAGNASGDDDDVGALESLIELVGGVALDLDSAGRLAARYT